VASRNRHAFTKRCLSAAVLVPVVLAAIWAGGPWYAALLLGVAGLMAKEWIDICFARDGRGPWSARPDPGAVAFIASVALACLAGTLGHYAVALLIAAGGLLAVGALSGPRMRTDGVILALGVFYIVLPITAAAWIGHDPEHGAKTLFWLLATVWATDSGAFLTGRWLGGPKLAPVISPAKTWSGFFGGLLGAALVAAAAGALGLIPSSGRFIALGLAVSLVAQGGDLLESRFKRHFEVKDSGTIIPGHGGVLDRLDSLLTALPFVAAVELWMGNGETLWR
jgi:phosphatidate cytidylyltransferase